MRPGERSTVMNRAELLERRGLPDDATTLGVLATQVFLDTYATQGVSADLAHEALSVYSPAALLARLTDPTVELTVVERHGHLVGFLDLALQSTCPAPDVTGIEVLRLYIQAPFQRQGLGHRLLHRADARARELGRPCVWLTAWSGNAGALAFYARAGYTDVGTTQYTIQGRQYENRVFAKRLDPVAEPQPPRQPRCP